MIILKKATIDSNNLITTAPCMITTNIAWHDSICKVVLDEIELVSVIDEEDYITKPFMKILSSYLIKTL